MSQPLYNKLIQDRQDALLDRRRLDMDAQTPFSLESAGYLKGVHVINDSAATNTKRLADSLAACTVPVVLLVEANQFTSDFSPLCALLAEKARVVVATGSRSGEIHQAIWPGLGFFLSAHSWEEAIDLCLISAKANDTILFSPGSRADEPFANFKERGAYFNRLIDIKRNAKTNTP